MSNFFQLDSEECGVQLFHLCMICFLLKTLYQLYDIFIPKAFGLLYFLIFAEPFRLIYNMFNHQFERLIMPFWFKRTV